MLSIFSYVSGPSVCLLGKVSVQVFCPFFNWIVCLPGVESCEFFIYFGDQTLVQGIIDKYKNFPMWLVPFSFADIFFSHVETFYFDKVPFVYDVHSHQCEVVSQCDFNFHLSDG